MKYEVVDFQVGLYDCDTIFLKVDKDVFQIPISKKSRVTTDLVGKSIIVENLYDVPLDKVVLQK